MFHTPSFKLLDPMNRNDTWACACYTHAHAQVEKVNKGEQIFIDLALICMLVQWPMLFAQNG